jgi:DNA-binding NtrC family response regulator
MASLRRPEILIAHADQARCAGMRAALTSCALSVLTAGAARAVLDQVRASPNLRVLIIDSDLPEAGLETVKAALRLRPDLAVILLASKSSEQLAIAALRSGCRDYLPEPVAAPDLLASVERQMGLAQPYPAEEAGQMIGDSRPMREVRDYLRKIAASEASTLITGETGTGKELAAAMIHRHSARRSQPLVCINCAAIPDGLLESELFGYERGAFTGAQTAREGTLKQADGGTVFFDEIGDMSPYAQAKVLRALESREARPLGARREVSFDIRVIAATNRNLEELMAEQKFRADLFFRLNVASVHLPPLRSRKEDLMPLSRHYIGKMNARWGCNVEGFTPQTLDSLLRYSWPGNVRELKNLIEAVFIAPPLRWISLGDLPDTFRRRCEQNLTAPQSERDRVLSALIAANWNKSQAAQKLRWSRMTLYRKMSRYQVLSSSDLRNPSGKQRL